jgi:hypothetical protein
MLDSDEKLKYIIDQTNQGKTPKEVSEIMGYSNFGSLKNFMSSRGYIWSKEHSRYIKYEKKTQTKIETDTDFRAKRIIICFENREEPKEIARKLGFKSHNDISEFMKRNNYEWSTLHGNYIKTNERISRNILELKELDKYVEILEILSKNYKELEETLSLNPAKCIKKYRIPGINTIKSIQMISTLNDMTKEYSRTYNISQKHIFEIALIEFFKKYGFKQEINHILKEQTESQ